MRLRVGFAHTPLKWLGEPISVAASPQTTSTSTQLPIFLPQPDLHHNFIHTMPRNKRDSIMWLEKVRLLISFIHDFTVCAPAYVYCSRSHRVTRQEWKQTLPHSFVHTRSPESEQADIQAYQPTMGRSSAFRHFCFLCFSSISGPESQLRKHTPAVLCSLEK